MALELVAERAGGWNILRSYLASDAGLMEEGQRYRQVFHLGPYPSYLGPVIKAEVSMVVQTMKLRGVPEASGSLSGQEVVLNYRAGINPISILFIAIAIAITIILFLVGYSIYKVVGVVPGVPAWVKVGLAAVGVLVAANWMRERLGT